MNAKPVRRLLPVLLLMSSAASAGAATTDEALRAENTRLRAQIEALEKSCAAATAAASQPPATPATELAAPPEASAAAPAPPAVSTAPPGYKLVPIVPVRPEDRYAETGCGSNSPADAPWKQGFNWAGLRPGMSMAEVEELLGKDHYDLSGQNRVGWQYGKCGNAVRGTVIFVDGQVKVWQHP